jgi:hypothetical protein
LARLQLNILAHTQEHALELFDLPTSMIGPCQEAKNPPDALGRSAGVISSIPSALRVGLSAAVSISRIEPDFHLLVQLLWLPRRLSLCFPASLETYQQKHQGLALLAQSAKWQDLAGLALKKRCCAARLSVFCG